MTRERNLKPEDTGRMGYRWPDEPPDGRPVIDQRPFWEDPSEQEVYEHVAATNPRRPDEGAMSYIARLATLAQSRLTVPKARLPLPAKSMSPKQRQLTDGQWNDRANELERQQEQLREPGEDG